MQEFHKFPSVPIMELMCSHPPRGKILKFNRKKETLTVSQSGKSTTVSKMDLGKAAFKWAREQKSSNREAGYIIENNIEALIIEAPIKVFYKILEKAIEERRA